MAKGFNLHYDPTFKHIVYHLEDKKQENISAYFDMAAFQIEKSTSPPTQTSARTACSSTAAPASQEYLPR